MLSITRVVASILCLVIVAPSAADDWPCWRGPDGTGCSPTAVPATWSKTDNIAWQTPVPGRGHSSPIICDDRIYLTSADETAKQHLILAYDRATGHEAWKVVAHEGGLTHIHPKNSYASATPACDGETVFATFLHNNALWVTAISRNGKILWQKNAGGFTSQHGDGPSPITYKSAVIISGDSRENSFIAALDRGTGEVLWRAGRSGVNGHGNYGSPIVANLAGRDQLLIAGQSKVVSYDPSTGEAIWSCAGAAQVAACTMAFGDGLAFASSGFPEKAIQAIRPEGSGDVTNSHVAWQTSKGITYVPSPLFHAGRLYIVNDQGVTTCFDATGKQLWQQRLGGNFTASLVLAGNNIYATDEAGRTTVFKAAPQYEQVAVNEIGSPVLATPAIADGKLYLRAADGLYCIGK